MKAIETVNLMVLTTKMTFWDHMRPTLVYSRAPHMDSAYASSQTVQASGCRAPISLLLRTGSPRSDS